jgi:hypothetical protein
MKKIAQINTRALYISGLLFLSFLVFTVLLVFVKREFDSQTFSTCTPLNVTIIFPNTIYWDVKTPLSSSIETITETNQKYIDNRLREIVIGVERDCCKYKTDMENTEHLHWDPMMSVKYLRECFLSTFIPIVIGLLLIAIGASIDLYKYYARKKQYLEMS